MHIPGEYSRFKAAACTGFRSPLEHSRRIILRTWPAVFFVCFWIVLCFQLPALGFQRPDPDQGFCYDAKGYAIECLDPEELYAGLAPGYQRFGAVWRDNGDGTLTDRISGLIWLQATADTNADGNIDSSDELKWQEACDYCDRLRFAGHQGWRLPSRRELASLSDTFRMSPNPPLDSREAYYWSASTYTYHPINAWGVNIGLGQENFYNRDNYSYVLCVRGGSQKIANISIAHFWPTRPPASEKGPGSGMQAHKNGPVLTSPKVQVWSYVAVPHWSDRPAPVAPEQARPAAAIQIGPAGTGIQPIPTFSWHTAAGAVWYQLWISGDSGKVLSQWFPVEEVIDPRSGICAVTPDRGFPPSAYTWWVRAWNSGGYGAWSRGMEFREAEDSPRESKISNND